MIFVHGSNWVSDSCYFGMGYICSLKKKTVINLVLV